MVALLTEQAPQLPDPGVLETFDPLEHLFDGNQGIAEIPDHPDFLLRWWPRLRHRRSLDDASTDNEVWMSIQPDAVKSASRRASEEFGKLAVLGLPVPEEDKDIIRFVSDARRVKLPGEVEYSIVRRYRGIPLGQFDPRGTPIIAGYTEYLTQAGPQGYILYDVFKASQHLVLHEPSQDGEVKLIDTEPCAIHANYQVSKEHTVFQRSCESLQSWAESADAPRSLQRHLASLVHIANQQHNYFSELRT